MPPDFLTERLVRACQKELKVIQIWKPKEIIQNALFARTTIGRIKFVLLFFRFIMMNIVTIHLRFAHGLLMMQQSNMLLISIRMITL